MTKSTLKEYFPKDHLECRRWFLWGRNQMNKGKKKTSKIAGIPGIIKECKNVKSSLWGKAWVTPKKHAAQLSVASQSHTYNTSKILI